MKYTIKLFTLLKEKAGSSQVSLELSEPATGHSLLRELFRQYPALEPYAESILLSINLEYASLDQMLHPGDEIVLFTPVSGG